MSIKVKYDGAYPNLCRGNLVVTIDDKEWIFESHSLSSGGDVSFDENWSEEVEQGPWRVNAWPKDFPENLKWDVLSAINDELPWGCWGGCV